MATNTTLSTASTTALNKTYYDRKLLETAQTKLVHARYGQKRNIPANNGKVVEFRRYNLFSVNTTSLVLTEGVKPTGQALSQTTVSATIVQYGAYVEISDLLSLTAIDQVIRDATILLAEQIGICMDWVTRDAMLAGASFQYAGGRSGTHAITAADKMSLVEVRKAYRTMRNMKARMFSGEGGDHFVCLITPSQRYDLQSDEFWQKIAIECDPKRAANGEIGMALGTLFVETTEGKVDHQSVLNAVNANTTTSTDFVLKNEPSEAEIAYQSVGGNKIKIGSTVAGATERTLAATNSLTESGGVYTVKLTAAVSLTANDLVFSEDAGAEATTGYGCEIHHALYVGADSYGVIDVEGSGTMKTIIKPAGSAGSADPLDQISTVGAKVMGYAAKVLNSNWIMDIQTAVTEG